MATRAAVSDEEDRILTAVFRHCEGLTARKYLAFVPTTSELAAKYAISERTVRNWRRAGCPFGEGQRRVLDWLAQRRYAPAGARAKFSRQIRHRKSNVLYANVAAAVAHARELKLAYKLNGIELPPNDWLRNFRCPRR